MACVCALCIYVWWWTERVSAKLTMGIDLCIRSQSKEEREQTKSAALWMGKWKKDLASPARTCFVGCAVCACGCLASPPHTCFVGCAVSAWRLWRGKGVLGGKVRVCVLCILSS